MINKIQLKVAEIKSYFELRNFDDIIERIIHEIYNANCKLMVNPNATYSKHQVTSIDCIIILGVNKDRNELEILWDLLHEFGHHSDPNKLSKGDSQNVNERIRREKTAWAYADEEFKSNQLLHVYKDNYIAYRDSCLNTYFIQDYLCTL